MLFPVAYPYASCMCGVRVACWIVVMGLATLYWSCLTVPALCSTESEFPLSLWTLGRLLSGRLTVSNLLFGTSGIQLITLCAIVVVASSKVSIHTESQGFQSY